MHCSYVGKLAVVVALRLANAEVLVTDGLCTLSEDGGCAASPNWPSAYGSTQTCRITGVPLVPLEVRSFDVEFQETCSWDYMTINADKYCGTTGPEGVVSLDGEIQWISDGSENFGGWLLCWPPLPPSGPPLLPPSPPSPPSPPQLPPPTASSPSPPPPLPPPPA